MSESEDKSGSTGPSKRRRRRRKPAGEGGGPASTGENPASGKASSSEGPGGARSKRRRGGRKRSDNAESGDSARSNAPKRSSAPARSDAAARGAEARRGAEAKRGAGTEARRSRSRRQTGEARPARPANPSSPAPQAGRPASPAAAPRENATPLYDQETPAPAQARVTRYGDDSDAPTPDIKLAADLPPGPPATDWDPESAVLLASEGGYEGQLSARICNVIGVRFVPTGRMYLYDAGDGHFDKGEQVVVEGDHGQRTATVTVSSCRRPPPRSLKRILRRASAADAAETGSAEREELQRYLGVAKSKAKELKLAIKVFRASFEDEGKRLAIYYSCEDKTDVRPLSRALSDALPLRVDLRHTGVRDEAKLVGGIGACGLELCCTTWLPSFVPVSIKHAKDQGLALNPSKISGQCGRLKCCLVYEQENYARLRKGLPKLGKRVITNDGFEGRVIEIDVLHQRIRVSVGRGESKVYARGEVEPMFASQAQGAKAPSGPRSDASGTSDDNHNDAGDPASKEAKDE